MPIYEFHCNKCDANFEQLLMGSDKPECPKCASNDVNRLLSACGFVSKGGGGETVSSSAGVSSCAGCSATSCASCGSS
ncbi:FmdB family zinc ribbon protein [Desulfatibacillum aliphaticivorans]|uniref:Regulatory protein, FmdB family n=1 Tax=Desulfatibacillum aliphaticivorans TaxID=218208 RepID=B8FJM8_DESAL|nr:zinc ribbon domain-containing protein [Desulfatibacillum aliphaticivorans]ACL05697.1 regulatory protein, FmdB family [Desulfatibacillum aliphaticivorans]